MAYAETLVEGQKVIDIGSGQGIPGVVIAVMHPGCDVTLLEPMQKRAAFLRMVCHRMQLSARVVEQNAQSHIGCYDVIVSRAVADVQDILDWSAHLAHAATRWVLHRPVDGRTLVDDPRISYVDYL
jgi:16S rRNA (guanine527-N7)-methyltransferase